MSGDKNMPPVRVAVKQGDVEVTYVHVLRRSTDVIILEIGTRERYPALGGYNPGCNLTLWPEDWARRDGNYEQTVITLAVCDASPDPWDMSMQVDRHSVHVALWRPLRDGEPSPVSVYPKGNRWPSAL